MCLNFFQKYVSKHLKGISTVVICLINFISNLRHKEIFRNLKLRELEAGLNKVLKSKVM